MNVPLEPMHVTPMHDVLIVLDHTTAIVTMVIMAMARPVQVFSKMIYLDIILEIKSKCLYLMYTAWKV